MRRMTMTIHCKKGRIWNFSLFVKGMGIGEGRKKWVLGKSSSCHGGLSFLNRLLRQV